MPRQDQSCPSGKTYHPDRASANEQLTSLKRDKKAGNMHVYKCTRCAGWHIGHQPGIRKGLKIREREKE